MERPARFAPCLLLVSGALLAAALLASCVGTAPAQLIAPIDPYLDGTTLFLCDFESFEDGRVFGISDWRSAGFDVSYVDGFDQDRAHVSASFAGTGARSLRITYPANTYGTADNGAQAPLGFPPAREIYVSYRLMFGEDFDWGGSHEGGKLPGISGGDDCSGGEDCTGENGFSARLMWRTGGKAVLYLYHMDKPGTYGEDFELRTSAGLVRFERGRWYAVTEQVTVNAPGASDGAVRIWIDGEPALDLRGLRFVTNGDLADKLYFSTFHGGSDATWAPSADCHAYFDDIRIFSL